MEAGSWGQYRLRLLQRRIGTLALWIDDPEVQSWVNVVSGCGPIAQHESYLHRLQIQGLETTAEDGIVVAPKGPHKGRED